MIRKLKLSLRLYSLKPEKECGPSDRAYYGTYRNFYFEIQENPYIEYDQPRVRMVIMSRQRPIVWLRLIINPKKIGIPITSRSRQGGPPPAYFIQNNMLMAREQHLILKDEGIIESNS